MNEQQHEACPGSDYAAPSASERVAILGSAVRRERQAQGISQQRLADAIGTDQAVIARLEAGKHNTGIATYIKIADALGVNLTDLVKF